MKTLYVYTKFGCGGCVEIKQFLTDLQIPFVELNVETNSQALEKIHRDGHRRLPQVYADNEIFMPGGWDTIQTMRRHEILERLETSDDSGILTRLNTL